MHLAAAEQLLGEFKLWHDLDREAKHRYQAQLAPDFKLMMFLRRDENALSSYVSMLLDPRVVMGKATCTSPNSSRYCPTQWPLLLQKSC